MSTSKNKEPGETAKIRLALVLSEVARRGFLPEYERQWIAKLIRLYPKWSQAELLGRALVVLDSPLPPVERPQ